MVAGHCPSQTGQVASGTVGGGLLLGRIDPMTKPQQFPMEMGKEVVAFLRYRTESELRACQLGEAADNVDHPNDWRQQRPNQPWVHTHSHGARHSRRE